MDIKNLKIDLEHKILKAKNVVIVPHTKTDLDAIGSALGISLIAKKFKKDSMIVVDSLYGVIDSSVQTVVTEAKKKDFSIVTKGEYLENKKEGELFVLTDVNSLDRTPLEEEIKEEEKENIVVIDHHHKGKEAIITPTSYINPEISSACEIVTKLLCQYRIKYDEDIATYLLAGIYLDTNKLQKNAKEETMNIVGKLIGKGATIHKVNSLLVEDFESDRKIQELVNQTQFFNLQYATALGSELEEYTEVELAKAADYLLKFGPDCSFAIGNIGDNITSIKARSNGKIDVQSIMMQFGGGGHSYSATASIKDKTPMEVGKILTKVLKPTFYIEEV